MSGARSGRIVRDQPGIDGAFDVLRRDPVRSRRKTVDAAEGAVRGPGNRPVRPRDTDEDRGQKGEGPGARSGAWEWFVLVPHTGFEPVISALRGRCPRPLDECGAAVSRPAAKDTSRLDRPANPWRRRLAPWIPVREVSQGSPRVKPWIWRYGPGAEGSSERGSSPGRTGRRGDRSG